MKISGDKIQIGNNYTGIKFVRGQKSNLGGYTQRSFEPILKISIFGFSFLVRLWTRWFKLLPKISFRNGISILWLKWGTAISLPSKKLRRMAKDFR